MSQIARAYGEPSTSEWVRLNTNESAIAPSPHVVEAIGRSALTLNRYASPHGEPFRSKLAAHLGRSKDTIVVSNGADGSLSACFRAFCNAGDIVGLLDPSYPHLKNLALMSGCTTITARVPNGLLSAVRASGVALTVLVNPNSPLGSWVSAEEIEELLPVPGILVIDEAYSAFAPGDATSLLKYDNVVIVRSFSKAYGLAGVRLGYALTSVTLANALSTVQDPYPVSGTALAAGVAALEDEGYYRAYRDGVLSERIRLTKALTEAGWTVMKSDANFIFVLPGVGSVAEHVQKLAEARILVRVFASIPGGFRISVGTPDQNDMLLNVLLN